MRSSVCKPEAASLRTPVLSAPRPPSPPLLAKISQHEPPAWDDKLGNFVRIRPSASSLGLVVATASPEELDSQKKGMGAKYPGNGGRVEGLLR